MLKPQLASACKSLDKLKFPLLVEPKLDGIRCLVHLGPDKIECYSRTLKPLVNFTELVEELKEIRKDPFWLGDVVLDGEILATDGTFDSTISRGRSHEGKNTDIGYKFHIFDVICDKPLIERKGKIYKLEGSYYTTTPWTLVNSLDELMEVYHGAVKNGYEGLMVKKPYSSYHHGRNVDWLKLKPFSTADLKIVAIIEGQGKASGMTGRIIVEGDIADAGEKGVCSEVGTGFTDELRKDMFNNPAKYLDKIAEIQYQEVTKASSLRFPSFKRMRDDLND